MNRRCFCAGLGATLTVAFDAGAAPPDVEHKRLENRLELWHNFAKRTQNLTARYTTTRQSALLSEPLVATGTLIFVAPATLVLADDGSMGSTTRIEPNAVFVVPNRAEVPAGPRFELERRPAANWLSTRLLRLFAPNPPDALVEDCRTQVPRSRGYRLELLPPRGSAIRQEVRSLTVQLDPVAGAVIEIVIAETQGDRIQLRLADHRQNLPAVDVSRRIAEVDSLLRAHGFAPTEPDRKSDPT